MGYQSLLSSVQFAEHPLRVPWNASDLGGEGASDVPPALRELRSSRKGRLGGHSPGWCSRGEPGVSEGIGATWFSLRVRLADTWGQGAVGGVSSVQTAWLGCYCPEVNTAGA